MKGGSAASRWGRCLRAPVRVLCSVRDLYVKGMNGCAGRVQYGAAGAIACPSYSDFSHSRSFSSGRSSASDEDLRELIRAVSRSSQMPVTVRRSQSVVAGRIDEDAPCDFKEDVKVGSDLLFPRNRSYAVGIKRRVKVFA